MAGEKVLYTDTYIAGADLSAKKYFAVKMAAGKVVLAGAGESAIGILAVGEEKDKAVTVNLLGRCYAIAGAAFAAGANLTPDAAGKLVTAGANNAIIAVAKSAAGAANDIVDVTLITRASAGTTGLAKAYVYLHFPVSLVNADNADLVTDFAPGFAGKIVDVSYIAQVPATTADKTASISLEIGATAVTGGVIELTTVKAGTVGKITAGTAITAKNIFDENDTISVVAADTAATFIEGSGTVIIKIEI